MEVTILFVALVITLGAAFWVAARALIEATEHKDPE